MEAELPAVKRLEKKKRKAPAGHCVSSYKINSNTSSQKCIRIFTVVISGSCRRLCHSCLGKGEKSIQIILFMKNCDHSLSWGDQQSTNQRRAFYLCFLSIFSGGKKRHEKKAPKVWPCTLYMHLSTRFLGSHVLFMQILSFFPLLYACDILESSLCPRTSNRVFVDDMCRGKKEHLPSLHKFIFYTT